MVDLLEAAIEAGEIPDQPYKEILPNLCWDYVSAILIYWLADDTEDFANTTQVVDQSVEIAFQLLKGGLIGKSLDLISFLFRSHVLNNLDLLSGLANTPGRASSKRRFMGGKDV